MESKNPKDFEAKKNHSLAANSNGKNKANFTKFWVSFPKRIIVGRRKISETNLLIFWQLALMPLASSKTKSMVARILTKLSLMSVIKRAIMLVSIQRKIQKTSINLGNFRVNNRGK